MHSKVLMDTFFFSFNEYTKKKQSASRIVCNLEQINISLISSDKIWRSN